MTDVAFHQTPQGWSFKALTPKAREAMGSAMGGPWRLAVEVFWQAVPPEKFASTVERLTSMGLDCTPPGPKRVDISKYMPD